LDFENNTIKFPKIWEIEVLLHKTFEQELQIASFSKSCPGTYCISILGEDGKEVPVKKAFSEFIIIGVKVGITNFAVISTEEKVENPMYSKNSLKRLKVLRKRVNRSQT